MAKKKRSRKLSAPRASADTDLGAIELALKLIQALPPPEATYGYREREARTALEEGLKPLLERLDTLCERHLPEALVPSPCGQSRLGNALCRPWVNLLGCHDACGRCREQALRALRLLREGIVDGKPSERFMDPAIIAAKVEQAARASEWERRFSERSRDRMRAQFERMRDRLVPPEKNTNPGATDPTGHAPTPAPQEHKGRAIAVAGAFGMANPKISTNIRTGRGEHSDELSLDQVIEELGNLIDRIEEGSPTPKLVERVAGLMRWTQQDRQWRHSSFDEVTLELLEIKLRESKTALEKALVGDQPAFDQVVKDLDAMHRALRSKSAAADASRVKPPVAVPVLTPVERAVLDILLGAPAGKGIRGEPLLRRLNKLGFLNTSFSDLTSRIIPKLREEGVVIPDARGGRGYWIDRTKLPEWVHHLPPTTAEG